MRRILLVLTVAAIMVAMMAATAVPAFGDDKLYLCEIDGFPFVGAKTKEEAKQIEKDGGECQKIREARPAA